MKKYIKDFFVSILFGIIVLFLFNYVGQFVGIYIPINILTVLIVGFLRLPGIITLLVILII